MGWVRSRAPLGDPNFGKVTPCACKARLSTEEQQARLLRWSGLGALRRCTFASLNPQGRSPHPEDQHLFAQALEAARAFAENPAGWLVFTGPSGAGKTHLTAAIVNRCVERGQMALYISTPDLLDRLRSAFAPWSEFPYDALYEQVCTVPVLALDDLGAHATTAWAEEKLFQVLNARWREELPTVVVLAVPLEGVEERLRTRLTSGGMNRGVLPLAQGGVGEEAPAPLPKEWERMTFSAFQPSRSPSTEAAYRAARAFAEEPSGWLVLSGPCGSGKTHLAVAIYQECRRRGRPARIVKVPELLDHLRATFAPDRRLSYDRRFEGFKTAPLLILDDFGAQAVSPWAEEKLYQLLAYRHEHHLPTVITVLHTQERQEQRERERLWPAIASRLKDERLVTHIYMDAPDYRDRARRRSGRER
ncbi:MAG: ATP-binding protein [Dehalococcoidia bacterium]